MEPADFIRTLRQDCPGVKEAWQAYVAASGGEARGLYNDAAVVAQYLVDSYERGETSEFPAVFATLEAALRDGPQSTRDLAGIGILEAVQNVASGREFGADVFCSWLGPVSVKAWNELKGFWRGNESVMDVYRSRLKEGE